MIIRIVDEMSVFAPDGDLDVGQVVAVSGRGEWVVVKRNGPNFELRETLLTAARRWFATACLGARP